MMTKDEQLQDNKTNYRKLVNQMGKKEFTLLKMQEYGFWPKDLPTPYERQANETKEMYENRKKLLEDYEKICEQLVELYKEKDEINNRLKQLQKQYDDTWDYDKIRANIASQIMKESKERRAKRKAQKEEEKIEKSKAWKRKKEEQIVFIGKGYSNWLAQTELTEQKKAQLLKEGLPLIETDYELAHLLELEYKELRFLAYHRDVVTTDHYYRYTIPKKNGSERCIAAPKQTLKKAQRNILEKILEKVPISQQAHGFTKGRSVVSGAMVHKGKRELLINVDLENFFPTITFERVAGLFYSLGYCGHIASILAMLCTYCERMPIEVKGEVKYVKSSERILPQGSPASPIISNLICRTLDKRLNGIATAYGVTYTRYADDMSFSFLREELENKNRSLLDDGDAKTKKRLQINKFMSCITHVIEEEGFCIKKEKTHYIRQNNRQCITGIVVNNEELGIPKKWVKQLRAGIYNAKKAKQNGTLTIEKIQQLSGMVCWLKSVNEHRYHAIIQDAYEVINCSK